MVNDWSSYNPTMLRTQVSNPLRTYCVDEHNNPNLESQVLEHDYSVIYDTINSSPSKSESVLLSPSIPTSKKVYTHQAGKRKHQIPPGSCSKDGGAKLINKKCNGNELKSAPTKRSINKSGTTSSSPTRVKSLAVLRGKMGKWAASKIELATLQKQCFLQEHKQKLLHMEKRHEQSMAFAKEEFELKKKQMTEEHEAKMAILSSKLLN